MPLDNNENITEREYRMSHQDSTPLTSPSSWTDRLLLIFSGTAARYQRADTAVVHPCIIDKQRILVYEKGLAARNAKGLAILRKFAHKHNFGILEDRRTGERQMTFDRRVARTIPKLVLAGGLLVLHNTAYADGPSKFNDWLGISKVQTISLTAQPGMDTSSEACLGCHDDSRGQYIAVKNADSPMQFAGSTSANHPIGMDYKEAVARYPNKYQGDPVNGSCDQVGG